MRLRLGCHIIASHGNVVAWWYLSTSLLALVWYPDVAELSYKINAHAKRAQRFYPLYSFVCDACDSMLWLLGFAAC